MRKIQRQLKNFLRSKKLLTRFKLNCRNCITGVDNFNFGRNLNPSLGYGFIWSGSPEGHHFWSELEKEFRENQSNFK